MTTEAGKRLLADDLCWPEPGPDLTGAIAAIEAEAVANERRRIAAAVRVLWAGDEQDFDDIRVLAIVEDEQPPD